jgi:hypothetical protein
MNYTDTSIIVFEIGQPGIIVNIINGVNYIYQIG